MLLAVKLHVQNHRQDVSPSISLFNPQGNERETYRYPGKTAPYRREGLRTLKKGVL